MLKHALPAVAADDGRIEGDAVERRRDRLTRDALRLGVLLEAREPGLEGRLVITPHAAWFTPESEHDTRVKSAETMRAALLTNRPQNVITPDMF